MARRFPWQALEFALFCWGVYHLAHAAFYVTNAIDQIRRFFGGS